MKYIWDALTKDDFEDYVYNFDVYVEQETAVVGYLAVGEIVIKLVLENSSNGQASVLLFKMYHKEGDYTISDGGMEFDSTCVDMTYDKFVDYIESNITDYISKCDDEHREELLKLASKCDD